VLALWFDASRFERLGRRVASAPRAFLVLLAALTALLSPGVIRVDLRGPTPATTAAWPDGAAALGAGETALFSLDCDAGAWSRDCLSAVDTLPRLLAERTALVARVDSLSSRPLVMSDDGRLVTRPLVPSLPVDAAGRRRLRARAGAERAALVGLVAPNERTALVRAQLVPGTTPRDAHALIESLRGRLDRRPAVSFGAVSAAHRAQELELSARDDLARVTACALAVLALLGAVCLASPRAGLGLAALAGLSLAWCAGVLGLGHASLLAASAVLPLLVATSAAGTATALAQRVRVEQRSAAPAARVVARAFGAVAAPLCAAALAGALGFVSLSLVAGGEAGRLAFALALALGASAVCVGLGVPAGLLAFPRREAGGRTLVRASSLAAPLEAALARLDGALRARGPHRARRAAALLLLVAAGLALRDLSGDSGAAGAWSEREGMESVSRSFGGAAPLRAVLDSGTPGGAEDPRFLEQVLDFERAARSLAGLATAESLLDTALLPAMRARHDDDPGFAVVPPTREQVQEVWDLLEREAPATAAAGLDASRRYVAVELLADAREPGAIGRIARDLEAQASAIFGRPDRARITGDELEAAEQGERLLRRTPAVVLLSLLSLAGLATLALDSAVLGALAALPAALAIWLLLGAMSVLGIALDPASALLPPLVAAAAAGPALVYLSRVRELGRAGAETHVAVSVALRDTGRSIAEGALASLSFLALLASSSPSIRAFGALACAGNFMSTLAVLVALPLAARTLRPESLIGRNAFSSEGTLSCVEAREGAGE
jgi:predicted RND superfamily exporter protein